jgi:hypothetical protein
LALQLALNKKVGSRPLRNATRSGIAQYSQPPPQKQAAHDSK